MSLETYRGFATPDPALSLTSDGRNYIETVWGRGYVLRDPSSAATAIHAA